MKRRISRRSFSQAVITASAAGPALSAVVQNSPGDVPWLSEVQQPPAEMPAAAASPQLAPLLVDDAGAPIVSVRPWNLRREQLRRGWLDYLGSLEIHRGQPPRLDVVEEDQIGGVTRQLVRYEIEPGLLTEAYLLKPSPVSQSAKLPGVAVFHSTVNHSIRQPAGVEGRPEKAFGLKLAQRGCVAFCPRNFLWPDNHHIAADDATKRFLSRHPRARGMARMLFDAQVAIDILAAQPEVDADRLGAVGHSLGAKEVLYLAAFDDRVKVTVSSEGGIGTTFSNWDAPWYLGERIRHRAAMHEHHELLALCAPRPFLLIGGESADGDRSWPFIVAALPVYRLYGDRPRLGLFNHRMGHSVPPEAELRIYEWFEAYL